jgi:Sulfotransferase domain
MSLRVVGAGLGRTGTMSLKLALEQLLGGRCYHMVETFERPDDGPVWVQASKGKMPDWNAFLADYNAAVDWPACEFWREMSDANPDALVLLSVRESADAWWKSANATIFQMLRRTPPPDGPPFWQADFFGPRISELLEEDSAKAYYEQHNATVRATARPDRLLEYRAGTGWEPLCAALDMPVPDAPFPHTNTTEEFQKRLEETPDA